MRKIMLMSAALLAGGVASGYAQGTINPDTRGIRPAPGPAASDTGTDATAAPPHRAVRPRTHARGAPAAAAGGYNDPENPGGGRAPADQYTGVPPTSAYQGGAGSPFSSRATHIDRADTRSVIAPRLPNPDANGNSPQAYLGAAQRALARNQTGAAQEALERAQTRILTRSTDPSMANVPDNSGIAQAITDARRAL